MDGYGAYISHAARGMQKPELKSFKWARGARVALFRSKWTDVLTKLLASAMNMLGSVIQRCTNVGLKQAEKKTMASGKPPHASYVGCKNVTLGVQLFRLYLGAANRCRGKQSGM